MIKTFRNIKFLLNFVFKNMNLIKNIRKNI